MIDLHNTELPINPDVLQRIQDKMTAYIFPNIVRNESEQNAFDKACMYQYYHEATQAEKMKDIPDGAVAFKIGDFSMNFDQGWLTSEINRKNICPAAYAVLLRQGLLYRGVEGRC